MPTFTEEELADFPILIADSEMKRRIIHSGPSQPPGPFPSDNKQNGRSFSSSYYTFVAKSGLKLNSSWLCYSSRLDCVYCQPCWLFPQQVKKGPGTQAWDTGVRDWKHLSERVKSHETHNITLMPVWFTNNRDIMVQLMTFLKKTQKTKETFGGTC